MNFRAKMKVESITDYGANYSKQYKFRCQYSNNREDNSFSKYTPSGELSLHIDNPEIKLNIGDVYYLDFTKAE